MNLHAGKYEEAPKRHNRHDRQRPSITALQEAVNKQYLSDEDDDIIVTIAPKGLPEMSEMDIERVYEWDMPTDRGHEVTRDIPFAIRRLSDEDELRLMPYLTSLLTDIQLLDEINTDFVQSATLAKKKKEQVKKNIGFLQKLGIAKAKPEVKLPGLISAKKLDKKAKVKTPPIPEEKVSKKSLKQEKEEKEEDEKEKKKRKSKKQKLKEHLSEEQKRKKSSLLKAKERKTGLAELPERKKHPEGKHLEGKHPEGKHPEGKHPEKKRKSRRHTHRRDSSRRHSPRRHTHHRDSSRRHSPRRHTSRRYSSRRYSPRRHSPDSYSSMPSLEEYSSSSDRNMFSVLVALVMAIMNTVTSVSVGGAQYIPPPIVCLPENISRYESRCPRACRNHQCAQPCAYNPCCINRDQMMSNQPPPRCGPMFNPQFGQTGCEVPVPMCCGDTQPVEKFKSKKYQNVSKPTRAIDYDYPDRTAYNYPEPAAYEYYNPTAYGYADSTSNPP